MTALAICTALVLTSMTGCGQETPGGFGEACSSDRECESQLFCDVAEKRGFCTADCENNKQCSARGFAACDILPSDEAGVCLPLCKKNSDCKAGLQCSDYKDEKGNGYCYQ